jgi:hypothetical protein
MTIRRGLRVANRSQWYEARCKACTGFSCGKKNTTDWCWVFDSFSKRQPWRSMSRTSCRSESSVGVVVPDPAIIFRLTGSKMQIEDR